MEKIIISVIKLSVKRQKVAKANARGFTSVIVIGRESFSIDKFTRKEFIYEVYNHLEEVIGLDDNHRDIAINLIKEHTRLIL